MNIKKFSIILTITILSTLFTGMVFADDLIVDEPVYVYNENEAFFIYEFDDSTQSLPGGVGHGGDARREYDTKDGRGVLKFPAAISSANFSGTGFTNMKNSLLAGKEICVEYNLYLNALDKEFCLFHGQFMFNNASGGLLLSNESHQTIGASYIVGWNKVSFILYLGSDGNLYYKDFTLNGNPATKPTAKLPSKFVTPERFFQHISSIQIIHYGGTEAYLDYFRMYPRKTLNCTDISIDTDRVAIDTESFKMTFDSPVDETEALGSNVLLLDPVGRPLSITKSLSEDKKVLTITINEALKYSGCYTVKITELDDADNVIDLTKDIYLYVENEPLYSFDNINASAKTVDIKCVVPDFRPLWFATQIFDASGKLLDAELQMALLDGMTNVGTYTSTQFMSKSVPSGAKKVKITVFDGMSKNNVYTVLEQSL